MAFPSEDRTLTGKDGGDISAANASLAANYTVSPYLYDFTYTPPTDYYSKKTFWSTASDTSSPDLDFWFNQATPSNLLFPNDAQTLTGKDGEDISDANAKLEASYSISPYLYDFVFNSPTDWYAKKVFWENVDGVNYPFITDYRSFPTPSNLLFPNDAQTLTGKDGEDISEFNAKKQISYTASPYLYVFDATSWKNVEDVTYPYLYKWPVPGTARGLKAWTGSAWVEYPLKRWNGSEWVVHGIKYFDGIEYL